MDNEMPIQNDQLPANHQDAGNESVIEETQQTVDDLDLTTLSKNELAEIYEQLDYKIEEAEAMKSEVKARIFELIDTDSERCGNYLCMVNTKNEFPDLDIAKARDLGLTKVEEKLNTALVTKAYKNGVDLGRVEKTKVYVMRKNKIENTEE